jgi:hypothetical protein
MRILSAINMAICVIIIVFGCCSGHDAESTFHDNLFMGHTPPGRIPEKFAPGVISDAGYRLHGPVVFSPDKNTVCWSVIPPAIMSQTYKDTTWSDALPLPLKGRGIQAPSFSEDGMRMYYQAVIESGRGSLDIWWVEREEDGWSEPVNAGSGVNDNLLQSQPSVTADGTLYFTGTMTGVGLDRGIFRSQLIGDVYDISVPLEESVNSKYIDYCPWIAPDERYLIFASSRPRTKEPLFLHISFRRDDGSWSEPLNIHPIIQFPEPARFPSVSPDENFLFFISGNSVYWVDSTDILGLQPGT